MWKGLIDSNNVKAELGTILKVENRITNKTNYYLYDTVDNRQYLFKYSKNGKIRYESFENIKVDEGVSLVNNDYCKFMFAISLSGFVLGIVAITQKGYKKDLPVCSVIISALILLVPVVSSIKSIIKILNM